MKATFPTLAVPPVLSVLPAIAQAPPQHSAAERADE